MDTVHNRHPHIGYDYIREMFPERLQSCLAVIRKDQGSVGNFLGYQKRYQSPGSLIILDI